MLNESPAPIPVEIDPIPKENKKKQIVILTIC